MTVLHCLERARDVEGFRERLLEKLLVDRPEPKTPLARHLANLRTHRIERKRRQADRNHTVDEVINAEDRLSGL